MSAPDRSEPHHGIVFWIGLMIGVSMIAFGLHGMLDNEVTTRPTNLAKFAIGLLIVHDAILAPLAFAVVALGRRYPRLASHWLRAAFAASALLALITWPLVRGYGRLRDNPTVLPLNYGANLVGALVVIWLVAVGALVLTRYRAKQADPE